MYDAVFKQHLIIFFLGGKKAYHNYFPWGKGGGEGGLN